MRHEFEPGRLTNGPMDFSPGGNMLAAGIAGGILLAVFVVVALWPWHVALAILALTLGALGLGVKGYMVWEHHRADIEIKKTQARIPYASEQGFGYIDHTGQIRGYSHNMSLPPAFMPAQLPPPELPSTFRQQLEAGHIGPGQDFLLGYDAESGEPLTMPALTSLGIGGGQGFGKTTTAAMVLAQTVIKYSGEVKFTVIDPHMDVDGEETLFSKIRHLQPYFLDHPSLPNPVGLYGHEEEVSKWVGFWHEEFERRMRGGTGPMWVLVMDEGAAVFGKPVGKEVGKLIEDINRQARKVKMFVIVISQEWKASRTGSEMRDSIVTFIAHNMKQSVSELMLPSDVAKQTPRLKKGEIVLYNNGEDRQGVVPLIEQEDMRDLYQYYPPYPAYSIKEISAPAEARTQPL